MLSIFFQLLKRSPKKFIVGYEIVNGQEFATSIIFDHSNSFSLKLFSSRKAAEKDLNGSPYKEVCFIREVYQNDEGDYICFEEGRNWSKIAESVEE